MPTKKLTCIRCSETFEEWRSTDEKLLQAIFGETPLCRKCYNLENATECAACGKEVLSPICSDGIPYHPKCLPHADEELTEL